MRPSNHNNIYIYIHITSIAFFITTVLLNLVAVCLTTHPVLLPCYTSLYIYLTNLLSTLIMQELTSIFTLSSLSLVNTGTLCLLLFFPPSYCSNTHRKEYEDTSLTKLTNKFRVGFYSYSFSFCSCPISLTFSVACWAHTQLRRPRLEIRGGRK